MKSGCHVFISNCHVVSSHPADDATVTIARDFLPFTGGHRRQSTSKAEALLDLLNQGSLRKLFFSQCTGRLMWLGQPGPHLESEEARTRKNRSRSKRPALRAR
jgi:hypothetical protein